MHFLNLREPDTVAAQVSISETARVQRAEVQTPDPYARFVTHDLPKQLTFFSLFAVGQSAYIQEDYPAATRIIAHALDQLEGVDPLPEGTARAYDHLGWLYYQEPGRDTIRAEAALTRALTIDPQLVEAYISRGIIYGDQGNVEDALSDLNQALAINPELAHAYTNRGNVYVARGELEQALANYAQAIRIDPQSVAAYTNRGVVYDGMGNTAQALADFN